jgi:hypothetical protein
MYIEAEIPQKLEPIQLSKEYASNLVELKREIAVAFVDKIDETGLMLIKFDQIDVEYWTDFYSNQIHPCGFFNYIYKENHLELNNFVLKAVSSI